MPVPELVSDSAPSPETCELVENVATYATSEFDELILRPLREIDKTVNAAQFVDFELECSGLPQPKEYPVPLSDAEAGRIWRCVEYVAETASHLEELVGEARHLLINLSEPENYASRDLRAYRVRMREWFEERAAAYQEHPDA